MAAVAYLQGTGRFAANLAPGLAPPDAAVVVAGGDAPGRQAFVCDATASRIAVLDLAHGAATASLAVAAREAVAHDAVLVVEAGSAALDWIPRTAALAARLVVAVDRPSAGEALARLRSLRAAPLWTLDRPEPTTARVPVPRRLEPLVPTIWKAMRADTPSFRFAALRGTDDAVVAAARTVAAGHGVALVETDASAPGGLSRVRAALAACRVVLVGGTAALGPVAAGALAALISQARGTVLVADADLPRILRACIEATIEVPA